MALPLTVFLQPAVSGLLAIEIGATRAQGRPSLIEIGRCRAASQGGGAVSTALT